MFAPTILEASSLDPVWRVSGVVDWSVIGASGNESRYDLPPNSVVVNAGVADPLALSVGGVVGAVCRPAKPVSHLARLVGRS
jgi:hypothetical protein